MPLCYGNRTDSAKFLAAVHDKMGACKMPSGALTYFTNATTSGTSVRLAYRMACANGTVGKTMVYLVTNDGPRLLGYN